MKTKSILLFTLAILTITATTNAQNVPSYIPTNGLVGWWPFNGNANDESGNGNDGTVNLVTWGTDRFGNNIATAEFNSDYQRGIRVQNPNATFSNVFTYSFWLKTNGPLSYYNNIIAAVGQCNIYGPHPTYQQAGLVGKLGFSGWLGYNNSTNDLNDGIWHHGLTVIDWTGGLVDLYIDGVLNSSHTFASQAIAQPIHFDFGQLYNKINDPVEGPQNIFAGELDDIAIWNRALTPQEITALYTASSTNNNETSNTTANVPGAISYQAVARDAQGAPLVDANLQMRFTLIADSLSGTAEYAETHTLTTNSLGLFTTAFGAGTPVSNTFGNINWSAGNKFLKVQIDTGNGLVDIGTQQLLSTPYSMHSATSGAIKNPGLPVFADNAAALAGGLVAGDMYRTASGDLKIVY